jgi:glycosyltransferase involved in cell wall biosynthesis
MKKLSVIIPCYNAAKYIEKCIKSLIIQPYDDLEFIFVNDASTDNTLSIIRKYAENDRRFIVINKTKNSGVSAARNDALRIATGEYCLLLDSDDWISQNCVEIIYRKIEEFHFDLLIADYMEVHGEQITRKKCNIPAGEYMADILVSRYVIPIMPPNLFKKSIIDDNGIYFDPDVFCAEVTLFKMKYLSYASKIVVVADAFYYYLMNIDSATHKLNYNNDISALKSIERIYEIESSFTTTSCKKLSLTAFNLLMGFIYLKYARLGNTDSQCIAMVRQLFSNTYVKRCLSDICFNKHSKHKWRCMALYMQLTSVWGYRMLANVFRILNHNKR